MLGFLIIVPAQYFLPISAANYFELLWKAVIVGCVVCLFFIAYTCLFNFSLVKEFLKILKEGKKRKNKNQNENINL